MNPDKPDQSELNAFLLERISKKRAELGITPPFIRPIPSGLPKKRKKQILLSPTDPSKGPLSADPAFQALLKEKRAYWKERLSPENCPPIKPDPQKTTLDRDPAFQSLYQENLAAWKVRLDNPDLPF